MEKNQNIKNLVKLAINCLENMYGDSENIFCDRVSYEKGKKVVKGTSPFYSAISLIGLYEARKYGYTSSLNLEKILERLVKDIEKIEDIGKLGILLWVDTAGDKKYLKEIILRIEKCWNINKEKNFFSTMELAYLLSGLTHAQVNLSLDKKITFLLEEVSARLRKNFNLQTGLFYHGNRTKGKNIMSRVVRNTISSFANQIYPVYALSKYYEVMGGQEYLQIASMCVDKLISLQGEKGQWWWMYNVKKGTVAEKYPVYSVHQLGMAPMAIIQFSKVSKKNLDDVINKSINWVLGDNELGVSIVDLEKSVIWRAIQRKRSFNKRKEYNFGMGPLGHLNTFLCAIGVDWLTKMTNLLPKYEILYQARPYCLGWLLYALSGYNPEE